MTTKKTLQGYSLVGILFFLSVILFLDLQYRFGNYDVPFFIAAFLYVVTLSLVRFSSRITMSIVAFLVSIMAVSYISVGPVRVTERIGEWFFIFLCIGIVHYSYETFFKPIA